MSGEQFGENAVLKIHLRLHAECHWPLNYTATEMIIRRVVVLCVSLLCCFINPVGVSGENKHQRAPSAVNVENRLALYLQSPVPDVQ